MKSYIDCIIVSGSEDFSISLNPDIFETNIINIILLLGILFVVIKNFLTENLTSRKEKIVENIENAEAQLTDSNNRYKEAQKQWAQMDIIIREINQQMETTKRNILKLKWDQTKEELSKKFALAIEILHNRENKIFADVIKEVSKKALNRVTSKLTNQLGKTEQSAIINRKIAQLGD